MRTLALASLVLSVAAAVAVGSRTSGSGGYPAPGSCHVRGHGLFVLPDRSCTPGATNPAVTPATIGRTICVPGWSSSVRPPESVTEPQKRLAIAAYGDYDGSAPARYEFDHLIPLSLGGAPDSPRNLWPEPDYAHHSPSSYDPNPKDKLEYNLHRLVCDRRLSLAAAQRQIARGWVAAYRKWVAPAA
jgi:hypothetical protein